MRKSLPPLSRRDFLKAAGATAGGSILLLVGCRTTRPGESPPPSTAVPAPAGTPTPLPTRPRQVEITPTESFYVQKYQGVPTVDAATWQLTIDGLVEKPLTLSYADALARPRAEMMRTLECIGNPVGGNQIGNATWAGFWLADLLAEAQVKPEAVRARFAAADDYDTSVALSYLTRPGVLLAYEMNGEPLTPAHGFPLRIFMPGLYGQKMPKWITRISFIDDDSHRGYWEKQGWSETAEVKTNSQIMAPQHIGKVPPAGVEVFGVAYAGSRRVTSVEVGVEAGRTLTWYPAQILSGPSPEAWTQFYFSWTPPESTSYTLYVRATDETGFVQTEPGRGILEGAFPDGTDRIHNIVVKVG